MLTIRVSLHHRYSFLLILLLAATGAAAESPKPEDYTIQDIRWNEIGRATSARGTWEQNSIRDYVFEVETRCYCPLARNARVYVIQDKVELVEDLETSLIYSTPAALRGYRTIRQYLDLIDETTRRHPDRLMLRHNRYLGYPEHFEADPSYFVADDEIYFEIQNVRLLRKQ